MDIIEKLLEEKKDNLQTQEEIEKYNFLKDLLKDKEVFFKLEMRTVMGILEFLEVDEEERLSLYASLVSYKNYIKNIPQERIMLEK